MKMKVRKDTTIKDDPCYSYTCPDDGGILGMCYESVLKMKGMTFSFGCGICGDEIFMSLTQLRIATSKCEFKDGTGLIEMNPYGTVDNS